MAGATRYAGHVLTEHPYKSAVMEAIGDQGTQAQARDLGPVPSYEQGLFKWGGPAGSPTVGDLGTVSPFATPANVLETILHANRPTPSEQPSSYLTPAIAAIVRAATHLNAHGGPSKNSVLHDLQQGVSRRRRRRWRSKPP